MHASFQRLVRFKCVNGQTHFGDAGTEWKRELKGQRVETFTGSQPWDSDFRLSGNSAIVAEVLSPLETVPCIVGIGLNYRAHLHEMGDAIPCTPVHFVKYSTCLAGPHEDIPVHGEVQEELDYEGELCIVLGKDAKDLSGNDNVLEYVLGFTVGNDVSSRWWGAVHPDRSGGQHSYGKSFDKFAPIGPVIASVNSVYGPEGLALHLSTWVNGDLRQHANTSDMVFGIRQCLEHLSRGTTLPRGTVIFTGTPSGVGISFNPPKWLEHGDEVKIEIEKIGSITNKFVFECSPHE